MSDKTDALIDDIWSECIAIGSEASHFSSLGENAARKAATQYKDELHAEITGMEQRIARLERVLRAVDARLCNEALTFYDTPVAVIDECHTIQDADFAQIRRVIAAALGGDA